MLVEVNATRARHGLRPLHRSRGLGAAAHQHTRQMARHGYLEHSSPDGTPFWRRIERHYGSSGFAYWTVGENLLSRSGGFGAADAVRDWLKSPEHRANLLSRQWREMGIAAIEVTNGRGSKRTLVTLDFGLRRR